MINSDPFRVVVYLCHGSEKFFDQTLYSAMTLLNLVLTHGRHDYRIVIYSDRPDAFPHHEFVRTITLTNDEITTYKGPLEYVHRVKLAVLQRVYAAADPALYIYVDSDTRWLKLPDTAFDLMNDASRKEPIAYFYENEGAISLNFHPRYLKSLQSNRDLLEQFRLRSDPPGMIWNSGVVAFAEKEIKSGILNDVLSLNDELILSFKPINTVEQLALSLIAQNRCRIYPFEEYAVHYWRQTLALPFVLSNFFSSLDRNMPVEQLAYACGAFVISEKDLQFIQKRLEPRGLKKLMHKLRASAKKRLIDLRARRIRRSRSNH